MVRAIVRMRKVRRICCFNFDDILETAFEEEERNFQCVTEGDEIPFLSDTTLILHPHGYLPRRRRSKRRASANIVFSEDDYHKLYSSPSAWSNLVQLVLLLDYSAVFVGCSLKDPNLRRLLDIVAQMRPKQRHYALLPDTTTERPSESNQEKLKAWSFQNRIRTAEKEVRERDLMTRGVIPIWWRKPSEVAEKLREIVGDDA